MDSKIAFISSTEIKVGVHFFVGPRFFRLVFITDKCFKALDLNKLNRQYLTL